MSNHKMVYISDFIITELDGTPFGLYLDNRCMTHGSNIAYRLNERTIKKLAREYRKEMKGGYIRVLT